MIFAKLFFALLSTIAITFSGFLGFVGGMVFFDMSGKPSLSEILIALAVSIAVAVFGLRMLLKVKFSVLLPFGWFVLTCFVCGMLSVVVDATDGKKFLATFIVMIVVGLAVFRKIGKSAKTVE